MDLLKPGQEFSGRYRVERFLAAGGMGAVYVAEQLATELRVALKILFPQVLASKDALQKFEIEAKVAARVRSENIVQVLDAGVDKETGMPFMVMELLEGKPLEDLVEASGPVAPALTVTYMTQAAAGLDKAHFHRSRSGAVEPIVHRDLKPENLFLTHRENGEPVVKILDFGIAKVLTETGHMSQDIKGTPLFMAFEQAAGKPITPQTDIWALGLITFFLLTGRCYWKAASNPAAGLPALFAEVLSEPFVSPTERATELGIPTPWGPSFDRWLLRCLDRDPAQRFETAGQAAEELAAAFNITPKTWQGPASSIARDSSELASSATLVAPAAATGALTFSRTGQPERDSKRPWLLAAVAIVVAGSASFAYRMVYSEAAEQQSAAEAAASSELESPRANSVAGETIEAAAGSQPRVAAVLPIPTTPSSEAATPAVPPAPTSKAHPDAAPKKKPASRTKTVSKPKLSKPPGTKSPSSSPAPNKQKPNGPLWEDR